MTGTVLHVAQPTTAGVARVVADLVRDQVHRGWRAVVASPDGGSVAADVVAGGGEHRVWHASRTPGPSVATETRDFRRIVTEVAPDLVHLHSSKAGFVGRLVLRGRLPTVFQPHAWSFLAVGGAMRAGTVAWERVAARWCDALAVVSDQERTVGLREGVVAPYTLLPNGVDVRHYRPAGATERASSRQELGVAHAPLAVCVGRLSRQKGQDVLVRAWPQVRGVVPDAQLVLVGDGPDREQLAALAGPGVRLVGAVRDTAQWLRTADVVVLASRWEGMPLALLEGLASGRPVVATDVPGSTEALREGGGTIVPPDDAPALAVAVAALLADPTRADEQGAAGRASAERSFDVRVTAGAASELYARLLRGR